MWIEKERERKGRREGRKERSFPLFQLFIQQIPLQFQLFFPAVNMAMELMRLMNLAMGIQHTNRSTETYWIGKYIGSMQELGDYRVTTRK